MDDHPVSAAATANGFLKNATSAVAWGRGSPATLQGTVLAADDEPGILTIIKRALEASGLQVLTATDGRDAVEVFQERADEIVAVLLDWSMPRMTGIEAFDAIRCIDTEVPILFLSGLTQEEVTATVASRGLVRFLQKPFTPTALIEKLCLILAQQEASCDDRDLINGLPAILRPND